MAAIAILAGGTSVFLIARVAFSNTTGPASSEKNIFHIKRGRTARNLSLQPEAMRLSRRLGNRFRAIGRDSSVISGNLIVGTDQQSVNIVRQQTDTAEMVEIAVGTKTFTWNDVGAAKASSRSPNKAERLLVERLVFDSPDWFVLAQLRGASYRVVARNVRPVEAGGSENYTGPIWDMVQVSDPEKDLDKKSSSPWRLYFVNSNTGLIDKIVCELEGEKVETIFSNWTTVDGEKVPSHIIWKQQDATLMEFVLTTFTRIPVQ
jgi:hypothetical protein